MISARRHFLVASVMLALLAVSVSFAGCGGANKTSDPFVGTWQTGSGDHLVIGKSASGYTGAWVAPDTNPSVVPFKWVRRGGLSLFARVPDSIFGPAHLLMTYAPATGELIVTEGSPGTKVVTAYRSTLTRLSDSTALPSPSP